MDKEEEFLNKWEESREHRWRNALIFGVIYGLIVFLILGLVDLIDLEFPEIFLNYPAVLRLFFWILLGFLIDAFWMFKVNERKYKKLKEQRKNRFK